LEILRGVTVDQIFRSALLFAIPFGTPFIPFGIPLGIPVGKQQGVGRSRGESQGVAGNSLEKAQTQLIQAWCLRYSCLQDFFSVGFYA